MEIVNVNCDQQIVITDKNGRARAPVPVSDILAVLKLFASLANYEQVVVRRQDLHGKMKGITCWLASLHTKDASGEKVGAFYFGDRSNLPKQTPWEALVSIAHQAPGLRKDLLTR